MNLFDDKDYKRARVIVYFTKRIRLHTSVHTLFRYALATSPAKKRRMPLLMDTTLNIHLITEY